MRSGGALAAWQIGSGEEARAAEERGLRLRDRAGRRGGRPRARHHGLLPLLDEVLDAVDVPGRRRAAASAPSAAWRRRLPPAPTRSGSAPASSPPRKPTSTPPMSEALVEARPEDTVLTETFSDDVARRSAPRAALVRRGGRGARRRVRRARSSTPATANRFHGWRRPHPGATATGRIDAMALYAGQSVGAVQSAAARGDDRPGARRGGRAAAAPLGRHPSAWGRIADRLGRARPVAARRPSRRRPGSSSGSTSCGSAAVTPTSPGTGRSTAPRCSCAGRWAPRSRPSRATRRRG